MNKWIYPAIGDLPLTLVDNLTVKPLVEKMCAGGLKPRTVNKYVEYIKQVVKSLKGPNGEPVHKRIWDAETMDLPVVEYSEQKRPSLKSGGYLGPRYRQQRTGASALRPARINGLENLRGIGP
jgi:hypothetical protein